MIDTKDIVRFGDHYIVYLQGSSNKIVTYKRKGRFYIENGKGKLEEISMDAWCTINGVKNYYNL